MQAKNLLGDCTCVMYKGTTVYASQKTGISPILDWLAEGTDLRGFSAADKIVGKAAALLFVLAGVKEVYGEVMSKAGLAALQAHGIPCAYGTLTEHIINRRGDGICPFEATVQNTSDPSAALTLPTGALLLGTGSGRAKVEEAEIIRGEGVRG